MKFDKIRAIMEKEYDEIMKNRLVLSSLLVVPLIFAILLPATLIAPIAFMPDTWSSQNETNMYINMIPGGSSDSMQVALIKFFTSALLPFFMMLPAILPGVISSYSIIGEKKNRTLEPLLAAPVTEYDIMIGKALSAIIPSLLATWISAAIFFGLTSIITYVAMHRLVLPDLLTWGVGLFLLAPALSFLAVMATVIISSRVNDPRAAQQISVTIVLPILMISMVQFIGIAMISIEIIIALTVAVFVLDAITLRVGKALFEREEILTKWK